MVPWQHFLPDLRNVEQIWRERIRTLNWSGQDALPDTNMGPSNDPNYQTFASALTFCPYPVLSFPGLNWPALSYVAPSFDGVGTSNGTVGDSIHCGLYVCSHIKAACRERDVTARGKLASVQAVFKSRTEYTGSFNTSRGGNHPPSSNPRSCHDLLSSSNNSIDKLATISTQLNCPRGHVFLHCEWSSSLVHSPCLLINLAIAPKVTHRESKGK